MIDSLAGTRYSGSAVQSLVPNYITQQERQAVGIVATPCNYYVT